MELISDSLGLPKSKDAHDPQSALCIHSSAFTGSTNHQLCSTIVFAIEKYPHVIGPLQLQPMLFKSQLIGKDPDADQA